MADPVEPNDELVRAIEEVFHPALVEEICRDVERRDAVYRAAKETAKELDDLEAQALSRATDTNAAQALVAELKDVRVARICLVGVSGNMNDRWTAERHAEALIEDPIAEDEKRLARLTEGTRPLSSAAERRTAISAEGTFILDWMSRFDAVT